MKGPAYVNWSMNSSPENEREAGTRSTGNAATAVPRWILEIKDRDTLRIKKKGRILLGSVYNLSFDMMEIGVSEGTLSCNFPLAIIMATSAPKHEG